MQKKEVKKNESYWNSVNTVKDPELDVGIVDLGLVYDITVENGCATVTMTLTSVGCPMGPEIMAQIEDVLRRQKDITDVKIYLVWEPAWSPERMHPDVREMFL
jgi:metal-sulfur cluster biosynthetic enzyme